MTPADVRRLEQAIEDLGRNLRREMSALRTEVRKASNFQVGFQAISKGLTYVCTIVAAAAVIYGVFRR